MAIAELSDAQVFGAPPAVVAPPVAAAPAELSDAQVFGTAPAAAPATENGYAVLPPAPVPPATKTEPPFMSVQYLRDAMAPTPGYIASGILPLKAPENPAKPGYADPTKEYSLDWGPVRSVVNPLLDLLEGTGLATSAGGQNSPLAGKVSPEATGLLFSAMTGRGTLNPLARAAEFNRVPFPGTPDVGAVGSRPNTMLQDARPQIADPALAASVTAKQAAAAGQQLAAEATDLPAAHAAIDKSIDPAAPQLVPGDNPTTGKLTLDPGIAAAEYTASRGVGPIPERVTSQQAAFADQIAKQNDTRVRAIQSIEPAGDVGAVPALLRDQAAAADAVSAAHVAGVRTGAMGDIEAVDAAGQRRVGATAAGLEASRATADAEAADRVGKLQASADQRLAGMGGDLPAGREADVGAALRAPVVAATAARRGVRNAMYDAVDPGNDLALDMQPLRTGGADIVAGIPRSAKPMGGEEAAIFDTVAKLPDVERFAEQRALRTRITDQIRVERGPTGDPQAVRRLSMLLGHVEGLMDDAVLRQAASDAAAVRAGTMRPEDAIYTRLKEAMVNGADADATGARRGDGTAGSDTPGGPGGGGSGPASTGGVGVGPGSGQRGAGDSAMAPGPATQGRGRALETLHDALIRKGGVKDESGEFVSQDLDLIHHRGGGRLVNPNGLSHDYAREFAVQERFLPANADVNDFRKAVQSHQPVYRIDEAADAAMRDQLAHQGRLTEDAQFAAGSNIDEAAAGLGVRMSKSENDHAVLLHMMGAHPDDAIMQATRAGDETALQANAEHNAVGAPGVPLAARQAEMPISQNGLTPNLDPAAVARLRAANAQNVADKTLEGAPGVKQMLQGGPSKGTFATPAAALPNIIVKVGSDGGEVAKAYLAAGGDRAALSDAAAYSLRQAARRPDGTLDPRAVGGWMKARSSFLSVIPETAQKFADVANALHAVDVATDAEAAASKAGIKADSATLKAATDEARATLKTVTDIAQGTIDDAVASRAASIAARQNSAIGKFLGDAEPVPTLWKLLNDKTTGAAKARQLKAAIAGNALAEAGLSRMVGQAIEDNVVGVAKGISNDEGGLAANKFAQFIQHAEPALAELLSPEDMAKLKATRDMMVRDYRSAQVGVGSSTGQLTAGRSGVVGKLAGTIFGNASAGSIGVAIGSWLGTQVGFPGAGAVVGGGVGLRVAAVLQKAREAGIQNTLDLKAAAYLNPTLFRILTTDVTPKNRASLIGALGATLGRASLVGAAQGNSDRRQTPQAPRNALAH